MGDWCSKNEVKNITKNYARQLNTALKILEKERKLNNENRNNK